MRKGKQVPLKGKRVRHVDKPSSFLLQNGLYNAIGIM